jgi:hypothetical protein
MKIYKVDPDYHPDYDSPWDAIWYDGDEEDLSCLDCGRPLQPIWKAPRVRVEKREQTPDVFVFLLHYACSDRVRHLLKRLVGHSAEFLPLSAGTDISVSVIHPLLRVDLDDKAEVSRNRVSGNITVIKTYSFDHKQFNQPMHIFQVRQAEGSWARRGGSPCSGILVSQAFKALCDKNNIRGIRFEEVFAS